jgi:hypothetical protein
LFVLMLLISIVFALVPLAGIVWIFVAGSITTVDGMFMSLILLTLSGVFLLNVMLELRDRGLLPMQHKSKAPASKESIRRTTGE